MSLSAAFRTLLLAVLLAGVSPLVDAAGQTWIQIDKTARTLTLFEGDVPLLEFPVALGRNPIGPKREQGDGKTPEGRYFILSRLRNSRFHRALQVSYPSLSCLLYTSDAADE